MASSVLGLLTDFGLSGFWSVFLWIAGSFVSLLSPRGCLSCAAVEWDVASVLGLLSIG